MYHPKEPRQRFHICLNTNERRQIQYVMEKENIPDFAKAVRYCIEEKFNELYKGNKDDLPTLY